VIVVLGALAAFWVYGVLNGNEPNGIFGIFSGYAFVYYVVVSASIVAIGSVVGVKDRTVRRRRKFKAVAAAGSVMLLLVLLELPAMLDIVDYRIVFSNDPASSSYYNPRFRIDRTLIIRRHPHDTYRGRVAGDLVHRLNIDTDRRYDVLVRWDQNGFRNASDMTQAEIVVIGDSFVEAAMAPFEQIASSVLAGELDLSVMNLGTGGYGPQEELAILERFGLPARPRIVIWVFYEGNDLMNYHQYRFVMADWDGWVSKHRSYPARSFLPNALEATARVTRPENTDRSLAISRAGVLKPPSRMQGQTMYFGYQCPPLTRADRSALLGFAHILRKAKRACDAQDAKLLLTFAPNKWRVHLDSITPGPNSELSQWTINDLPDRLGGIARIEGVDFLDLTPPLRAASASGHVTYYLDDAHWNATGNRSAAIAIADVLRRNGWTESP